MAFSSHLFLFSQNYYILYPEQEFISKMMIKKRIVCFLFCCLCLLSGKGYAEQDIEYEANKKAFDAIGASAAYDAGFTGTNVIVAIVDNGLLKDHNEFKNKFSLPQKDEYNVQKLLTHGTAVGLSPVAATKVRYSAADERIVISCFFFAILFL